MKIKNTDELHKIVGHIYKACNIIDCMIEDIRDHLDEYDEDEELWEECDFWSDLYEDLLEKTNEIEDRYNLFDDLEPINKED